MAKQFHIYKWISMRFRGRTVKTLALYSKGQWSEPWRRRFFTPTVDCCPSKSLKQCFGLQQNIIIISLVCYSHVRFNPICFLYPYSRISKTAWIKREEDDAIENIYKRVGAVTGLNMETSEELQVSNYGIGGHYEPHFDFARREETNAFTSLGTGNRIATWLFYVSLN